PALQCRARRNESGGAATTPDIRIRSLRPLAVRPLDGLTRHHRVVAGLRAQSPDVPPDVRARSGIRAPLVVVAGRADSVQDHPGGALQFWPGRVTITPGRAR